MKKINSLLELNMEELEDLNNKINGIIKDVNSMDNVIIKIDQQEAQEQLFPILSTVNNLEIALKMLKVALKLIAFGQNSYKYRAVDMVVDYYCINKLGLYKTEFEEMIK